MWRYNADILGFWAAIRYSYTNYLTFFASLPRFVIPLTSGQALPRYLSMEISYVKWEKSRRYLWSRCTQNHIFVNLTVFHGTFPALLFGWQSFLEAALLNSDIWAVSVLWHGAAVGTASFQDTCPFQESSGCQHVCLLNTWHTGNVVMYQIY